MLIIQYFLGGNTARLLLFNSCLADIGLRGRLPLQGFFEASGNDRVAAGQRGNAVYLLRKNHQNRTPSGFLVCCLSLQRFPREAFPRTM